MEPQTLAPPVLSPPSQDEPVIVFEDVHLAFDDKVILEGVSFQVRRGHTKIFLGASGAGKSTILKIMLGLLKADRGRVHVLGERIDQMSETEMMRVRANLGMVFQEGALFDSLTVGENVGYKLYEETDERLDAVRARVEEVLGFVNLDEHIDKMPSELSGGQRRRVAIARAMAARPTLLLYDEPTTGLDPMTSLTVDTEIIKLRDLNDVTSVLVTHQLRDAFYIATHEAERKNSRVMINPASEAKVDEADFVMLRDGRIVFEGSAHELRASRDPYLQAFLS
jgi:phospholipid/cholesterol/gamma-HCH transport system ATP-binding protein